jgi:DNA-binding transcriptional LysR family regulator
MPKPLSQLDLNLLMVLDKLLSESSVTRAAKRLGLSQPATSSALGRLRDFFEDPLLVRSGRRLQPTAFATALREPIRDIISRIELVINRRIDFDPKTSNQEFTLAASDYSMLVLASALHTEVAAHAPNVRLRFVPLELAAVGAAGVAADIFIFPETYASGHYAKLFRDRWVFVVDKDNAEIGSRMTAGALKRLPFVRFAAIGTGKTVLDSALESADLGHPAAVTVAGFGAALLLIPGTRLVTLCPERLVQVAKVAEHVRVLKPSFAIPPLIEVMAWGPVQDSDPAHMWLRGVVQRVAASIDSLL